MAFLDNSGDIILDAVLTEVGRRRMANGNFNIAKFALGDDEIDYRLYNKEHASGSAYYDLEILQTPVFEAVTAQNSAINYGLLSITRRDLLYMPDIKLNTNIVHCVTPRDGVLTFAVNSETATKLLTSLGGGTANKFIGKANALSTGDDAKVIYLETGLDTSELAAMHVDRRTFSAGATSTESTIPAFNSETTVPAGGVSAGLVNYSNYMITTAQNLLYAPTVDRIDHSIITGPRGVFACFNINIIDSLRSVSTATRPEEYNRSGKVSQNVYGDGVLYDYIDTTVNVVGNNSTVITQLPVRLIRYASG